MSNRVVLGVRGAVLGLVSVASLAVLGGCAAQAKERPLGNVAIPVRDTEARMPADDEAKESPPDSEPAREFVFPKVTHAELASGVSLAMVATKDAPLVHVRLVVRGAGGSADGDRTGTAALAAHFVTEAGSGKLAAKDVNEKFAALGTQLGVVVTLDATTLSIAVTKDHLAEALELLGSVVREPRLDEPELAKIRKREAQNRQQALKGDDAWVGSFLVFRELYKLPASLHPYASFDATPDEIEKLTSAETRTFVKKWYTPKATSLVIAGPFEPIDAKALVDKSFGAWKGVDPPGVGITAPSSPEGTRIYVADRPGSTQCQVFLAALGPDHGSSERSASAAAGWQILGGGRAGKLESDLRDKRGLLLSVRSTMPEVSNGPQPLIVRADVSTPKLGKAVEGILAHFQKATDQAPRDEDVTAARRFLTDTLAVKWGTSGGIADGLASIAAAGRTDDEPESFVRALTKIDSFGVGREMGNSVGGGHVLVVVGDASKIAPMLTHFADVAVVNPAAGFARTQSLSHNDKASLDPPTETK